MPAPACAECGTDLPDATDILCAACNFAAVDDVPPSLAEVVARSRNRSDTDPSWRTDYHRKDS